MVFLKHRKAVRTQRALTIFLNRARRKLRLSGEINVLITDSHEMQSLNRRFRGRNKPTDVLSFPAASNGAVGDIAVSKEIAAQNA
jgi:probable rRNA maturation factor